MLEPLPQDQWTLRTATHLLSRAGLGGTPEERQALYELGRDQGVEAAVDSLINDDETWEDFPLPEYTQSEDDPNGNLLPNIGFPQKYNEVIEWFSNIMRSSKPLTAKLFKFLIDHLPINHEFIYFYQRFFQSYRHFDMLRKHAAGDISDNKRYGNFKQLIIDTSWSEAMMFRLDLPTNWAGRINENFGRELLELFTLGVNASYTEDDVGAASRAFTGRVLYDYETSFTGVGSESERIYAPEGVPNASPYQRVEYQDLEPKTFMGHTTMPDGRDIVTGDDIIDLIFLNIECAQHLAWKFWRYFCSSNPSEELVSNLAYRFKDDHDYEIRPLLRDIFLCKEFYSEDAIGKQIKDPVDIFIGSLKLLNLPVPEDIATANILVRLQFDIMNSPSIEGWPEPDQVGNQWLSADGMVERLNLPSVLVDRNVTMFDDIWQDNAWTRYPEVDLEEVVPKHLWNPKAFNHLINHLNQLLIPLRAIDKKKKRLLSEQYKKTYYRISDKHAIRELIRLIMAFPEYQMQ